MRWERIGKKSWVMLGRECISVFFAPWDFINRGKDYRRRCGWFFSYDVSLWEWPDANGIQHDLIIDEGDICVGPFPSRMIAQRNAERFVEFYEARYLLPKSQDDENEDIEGEEWKYA